MSKKPNDLASDIVNSLRSVTSDWTKTKKAEERSPASRHFRMQRMTKQRGVSFKDAAAEILPEAYDKVSGGGTLPANARQIMYACRPHIQKVTGRALESDYFTQTLLPNYLDETGVDWDVVYDARGHFTEPHGGEGLGLGTLEVRDYLGRIREPHVEPADVSLAKVKLLGPVGNFGAVLFLEKEGFDPLLRKAKIAERFDIAIMSTKGMSVTAARLLVDQICSDHDIPLLLMHDFDKSGFAIAGTLQRDTRRYEFQNDIRTVDLGLCLEDVTAMQLESEHQHHPKGNRATLMANLRENGATEADLGFMFADFDQLRSTRRVELNAMTSPQFVAFVERKLRENGIEKIIPEQDLLAKTYAELKRSHQIMEAVEDIVEEVDEDMEESEAPKNLQQRVRKYLKQHPEERWDAALDAIVSNAPG